MTLALNALLSAPIPVATKGLPPKAFGMPLRDVGAQGWNLFDGSMPLPACVLLRSSLDHNRRTMKTFLDRHGLSIAPHGKTTMAPQLFAEQIADGAWGMTAATTAHLFAYRSVGVSRILYANQLIDPVAVAFVLKELNEDPAFEFLCLVDSREGVDMLASAAQAFGASRPIDVLVELGMNSGRTGARTVEAALDIGRYAASHTPWLRVRGVEAFEGVVPMKATSAPVISDLMDTMTRTLHGLIREGCIPTGEPIVTAGGSAFFGVVVSELRRRLETECRVVLRSGCYLTNDHGGYRHIQADLAAEGRGETLATALRPALEVWGHVHSRPEPGLAVVALGKRDISTDVEPPIPIKWARTDLDRIEQIEGRFLVGAIFDQHLTLQLPTDHALAVGDQIGFGCSHPCTTFDKWRIVLIVDDDYRVLEAVSTFF